MIIFAETNNCLIIISFDDVGNVSIDLFINDCDSAINFSTKWIGNSYAISYKVHFYDLWGETRLRQVP